DSSMTSSTPRRLAAFSVVPSTYCAASAKSCPNANTATCRYELRVSAASGTSRRGNGRGHGSGRRDVEDRGGASPRDRHRTELAVLRTLVQQWSVHHAPSAAAYVALSTRSKRSLMIALSEKSLGV